LHFKKNSPGLTFTVN